MQVSIRHDHVSISNRANHSPAIAAQLELLFGADRPKVQLSATHVAFISKQGMLRARQISSGRRRQCPVFPSRLPREHHPWHPALPLHQIRPEPSTSLRTTCLQARVPVVVVATALAVQRDAAGVQRTTTALRRAQASLCSKTRIKTLVPAETRVKASTTPMQLT